MDRDRIVDALGAGAIGYLLKDAEPDELIRGIRAAARGESPLDPRAARTMLAAQRTPGPLEVLTEREREVLALVAEGLPNKQIARRLEITEKTVKAHLTSVFRTIGVNDRMQAGLWARRTASDSNGPDRCYSSSAVRSIRPRGHGRAGARRVRRRPRGARTRIGVDPGHDNGLQGWPIARRPAPACRRGRSSSSSEADI